jgi:integrase/recombinase XerD
VRDWLNEHPFKNELNASVICNLTTGAPIRADVLNDIMKQLNKRIIRLLKTLKISDENEINKLEYLVKTKKWNPYCIRHSAITADSDHLP